MTPGLLHHERDQEGLWLGDSVPELCGLARESRPVPPHLQIIQPAKVGSANRKAVFHRFDLRCSHVISAGLCRNRDHRHSLEDPQEICASLQPRERKDDGERMELIEMVHCAVGESQSLDSFRVACSPPFLCECDETSLLRSGHLSLKSPRLESGSQWKRASRQRSWEL